MVVVELLLLNLQSGEWSEIFILAGEKAKYFRGIKGAIL